MNPFFAAALPRLHESLGDLPSLDRPELHGPGAICFPVDATLGHEGIPQSGTGQTSLLTGVNGAELFGRHFGPWVPTALRDLVRDRSFLKRAVDAGLSAAFANAYPEGWPGPRGGRRVGGPPLAARGAGLLTRTQRQLAEGRAVASEIVNDGWRERLGFDDLPTPTAAEAGANLARIAADHRLTLHAHWSTDTAGHRGGMAGGVAALERVDAFVGGILDQAGDGIDFLICSDHGNLEDVRVGHTRNPSLGVWFGAELPSTSSLPDDLTAIPAFVLGRLGLPTDAVGQGS